MAPAAAPPTILAVSRPVSLLPFSVSTPSMGTSTLPGISSRSKRRPMVGTPPILLLPETTSVTVPATVVPAATASLSPTRTSCMTPARTTSPTLAVLEDTLVTSARDNWVPAGMTRTAGAAAGAAVEGVLTDEGWDAVAAGRLTAGFDAGRGALRVAAVALASRVASSASRLASSASFSRRESSAAVCVVAASVVAGMPAAVSVCGGLLQAPTSMSAAQPASPVSALLRMIDPPVNSLSSMGTRLPHVLSASRRRRCQLRTTQGSCIAPMSGANVAFRTD
jgi:hypothetical protein